MKQNILCFLAVLSIVAFSACKKVDFETNSIVNIRLTDAPFNALEVNVDIVDVLVKVENDNSGWKSLKVNAGIYNLLAFQNGKDTLLATGNIPATSIIKELKLVLGTRNSINIDNVISPLVIPVGAETGLVVNIDQKLNKDVHNIIVDFDAGLSVFQNANDGFLLKPFVKLK